MFCQGVTKHWDIVFGDVDWLLSHVIHQVRLQVEQSWFKPCYPRFMCCVPVVFCLKFAKMSSWALLTCIQLVALLNRKLKRPLSDFSWGEGVAVHRLGLSMLQNLIWTAQGSIHNYGPVWHTTECIKHCKMFWILVYFVSQVRFDVGRCETLSNIYYGLTGSVCHHYAAGMVC